jgi:hypothetical protein
MSFSSDNSQITNQAEETINLPSLKDGELFQDRLTKLLRNITNTVNSKGGGLYSLEERGSSERYYKTDNPQQFRNVYRKVFDFVSLNGANIGASEALHFPHEITGAKESAMIYANCTASDERRFTAVFPDCWIDDSDVYFTNPVTVELLQCDLIVNILKE